MVLPPVSVVVPTRERPAELVRSLRAIVDQSYAGEIECIVVFDQSPPEAPEIPERPGRLIRCMPNTRTPGVAGARNTGILAAEGQLLAFCDDDDEWLPGKLTKQVDVFERDPHVGVVGTGTLISTPRRVIRRVSPRPWITHAELVRARRPDLHPSTLLIRRSFLFGEAGLLDEDLPESYGEDYDFLLRASGRCAIATIQEPLVRAHWDRPSWFAGRWRATIDAHRYLLQKHSALSGSPVGAARIYGQIAFGYAALGSAEASAWARRSIKSNWRQPRGYLALAVRYHLLDARFVLRTLNAFGRNV